jgi:thiamine transport system substrate-binding protein
MVFLSCSEKKAADVVIWTYDSFVSEWGPGAEITDNFFQNSGLTIKWESSGDAGSLLSRLLLDGSNASADIILGLDQNMAKRAIDSGLFKAYMPKSADNLIKELIVDDKFRLIPFDYSYFAIIYDSETIKNPPKSLEDLTFYKNSLILMDPRTSSPGLGFLGWTIDIYGEGWASYWQRLMPSILTISGGWDTGYALFTKGEAPLVLSYTTSPSYHIEVDKTDRYRAAIFEQGHPIQIELAGLLAAAPHKKNAEKFLDFMLSEGFQQAIPFKNWMYPSIKMELPPSFGAKPEKTLHTDAISDAQISEWAAIERK